MPGPTRRISGGTTLGQQELVRSLDHPLLSAGLQPT